MTRPPTPLSTLQIITLPPQRFYWALLDVGGLPPRHRRDSKSLGYLFENTLPLPIENVQATYVAANVEGQSRVVACGMAKEDLRTTLQASPEALMLTPAALPSFVAGTGVAPAEFNVLVGELEPPRLRRMRWRLSVHAILILSLITAIVVVGIERRIKAAQQRISEARGAQQELIEQVLGPIAIAGPGGPPLELRMVAELRTLRQTRQQPNQAISPVIRDVTPALASLLESWPADLHVQTDSLSITPTSMTARGLATNSEDVQSLANSLATLDGWQLQQPEISTASKGVNATLQWKRVAGAAQAEAQP